MAKMVFLSATITILLPLTWSLGVPSIANKQQPYHKSMIDDNIQPNKYQDIINQARPQTQSTESIKFGQLPRIRKYSGDSDKAIRVTINDLRNRFVRLENMIGVLERVSYAISKPAAIIDAIRLFALAVSSVLMTTLNVS